MQLKFHVTKLWLCFTASILFRTESAVAQSNSNENEDLTRLGLTREQLNTVKLYFTYIGGEECTKLFLIDFEQYLFCASRYNQKRLPKQDDGEEEAGGFFQETVPNAFSTTVGILTETFSGINHVVNQTSNGQTTSLPNWIFNGVNTLVKGVATGVTGVGQALGGLGTAVGINRPPTPPPYFNIPPARPVGPSAQYPASSLARPTLVPRLRRTTLVPERKPLPSTSNSNNAPASSSSYVLGPLEAQLSPFQIQYVGPAAAPVGSESGQFFPAPVINRPSKPRPRATTTRSAPIPIRPIDTDPSDYDIQSRPVVSGQPSLPSINSNVNSISNSGFHSELVSSFANKLKEPSNPPKATITATAKPISQTQIHEDDDDIQNSLENRYPSVSSGSSYKISTTPTPTAPIPSISVIHPTNPNKITSPFSLWQAVAEIKEKPSTDTNNNNQHQAIDQSNNFVIFPEYPKPAPTFVPVETKKPSRQPPIFEQVTEKETEEEEEYTSYERFTSTQRPSTRRSTSFLTIRTSTTPIPRIPPKFVTESIVHPKFPPFHNNNNNMMSSTGSIATVMGNKRPVIVNNVYYPDLESALAAKNKNNSSTKTTEQPRKRRRRTSTTTRTPSPDLDYYEEETTSTRTVGSGSG